MWLDAITKPSGSMRVSTAEQGTAIGKFGSLDDYGFDRQLW